MNSILFLYLEGVVVLTMIAALGSLLVRAGGKDFSRIAPSHLLPALRWGGVGAVVVWGLAKLAPHPLLWEPLWQPTSMALGGPITRGLTLSLGPIPEVAHPSGGWGWEEALGLGLVLFVLVGLRPWFRLWRLRRRLIPVRSIGRVRVAYTDTGVPYSFWVPGEAWVVLPQWALRDANTHRIALGHEIQHHRQGDTRWRHVTLALRGMYPWMIWWRGWDRRLDEISEFACDEALIRGRVSPQAYGCCLLEAAEQMSLVGVRGPTALAMGLQPNQLKRRVTMLFQYSSGRNSAPSIFWASTALLLLVGGTSWGLSGALQDRSVTMDQAREMASRVRSGFPVDVNPQVVHALNRFVGTPDGRRYIRESVKRMRSYQSVTEPLFAQYQAPEELHAVAVMESGYRNLPSKVNPVGAAGVWQFIAGTAKNYGLTVVEDQDERLDVSLETDAALRYLFSNFYRFQDWRLAILGYNAGENQVQRGIRATGQRDAWKLIDAGFGGDEGYLSKVMAGVIILSNLDRL